MTDDTELWGDARAGDADAFGSLYDRHRERVFSQASRLMRSRVEAEDVTALVFLEAWRRRAAVRLVDGSILGWLLVTCNYVAANAARSARRHRAAMERIASQYTPVDDGSDAFVGLEDDDRAAGVRTAFLQLKPQDRDVLTLCIVHEMPMLQAAQLLDVPVGTVKSRLSRAKRRLAALTGSLAGVDVLAPTTEELR